MITGIKQAIGLHCKDTEMSVYREEEREEPQSTMAKAGKWL